MVIINLFKFWFIKLKFLFLVMLLLILTGCYDQGSTLPTYTSVSAIVPMEIGNPEYTQIEIRSFIDKVPHSNCDGANPKFHYHRSLSNASTTTYEVITEAGSIIRGTPVPGLIEAEIEAKIRTAISEESLRTELKAFALELVAEKGYGFNHMLYFQDTYFVGFIDVVFTDGVARVKVEELVNFVFVDRTSEPMDCPEQINKPAENPSYELPSLKTDTPQSGISQTTIQNNIDSDSLLPQQIEVIGSGVFLGAAFSNGMAEINYEDINSKYYNIQNINPNTSDSGCGISRYNVNEIWFSASKATGLFINGDEVGKTYFGNGLHGHIIMLNISAEDKICINPIPPGGYHIILGPHVYYHYDSYCFRGFCQ